MREKETSIRYSATDASVIGAQVVPASRRAALDIMVQRQVVKRMTSVSTIAKALAILDLFESDRLEWMSEDIARALGMPHSTCYRHLKLLTDMGYVVSSPSMGYTLGPKITLLGYHLRRKDPVIAACRDHAERLAREFPGSAMINRVFRQSFICIFSTHSLAEERSSFNPGDAMPLLAGANAKVIQAFLSRHLQAKLFEANKDYFSASGRGDSLQVFRKGLQDIRKARISVEVGAVRPDSVGVAAPILGPTSHIIGTFSFSFEKGRLSSEQQQLLADRVREIGLQASAHFSKDKTDLS